MKVHINGLGILMEKWAVDWIHRAQNRAQFRAILNTIINFRVEQKAGNFLVS